MLNGYSVRVGVPPKLKDQGFSFTLRTPDRSFHLSALTEEDRDEWIAVLDKVIERPLTPQDNLSKYHHFLYANLIHAQAELFQPRKLVKILPNMRCSILLNTILQKFVLHS